MKKFAFLIYSIDVPKSVLNIEIYAIVGLENQTIVLSWISSMPDFMITLVLESKKMAPDYKQVPKLLTEI